jgi:hypothetical protein
VTLRLAPTSATTIQHSYSGATGVSTTSSLARQRRVRLVYTHGRRRLDPLAKPWRDGAQQGRLQGTDIDRDHHLHPRHRQPALVQTLAGKQRLERLAPLLTYEPRLIHRSIRSGRYGAGANGAPRRPVPRTVRRRRDRPVYPRDLAGTPAATVTAGSDVEPLPRLAERAKDHSGSRSISSIWPRSIYRSLTSHTSHPIAGTSTNTPGNGAPR